MNLSNFKEGSSSCPCSMTLYGELQENEDNCMANSLNVATCARRFSLGCWSYVGPGCEKKWYGTHVNKPNGEWNRVAENMMINFAETGHPIFQATSPLEGELKIKGGGKKPLN